MDKNILVIGGAGYIGSHTCKELEKSGFKSIIFDNFSNSNKNSVAFGEIIEGDAQNFDDLNAAFDRVKPVAVIHFAGSIEVGESVREPVKYYQNNIGTTANILRAMREHSVSHIIFSSTAAVYGEPQQIPIPEDHTKNPQSPYGASKLAAENLILASVEAYNLKSVILRYFNACGADPDGELGENHNPETHIIPRACLATLGKIPPLEIYGNDYENPDGTAIRDYVHVSDLAAAHVKALEYLLGGGKTEVFNVGTGNGISVQEIISAIEKNAQISVPISYAPRRAGDVAVLVADSSKISQVLGWTPQYSTPEIITMTAWNWFKNAKD